MAGSHHGFSLISQQMTFEIEALKTARYNAAQATSSGNLELLELAVSQLCDLAALEQIPVLKGKPDPFGVRMDRFKLNLAYFNRFSNYISGELGKKWALLRVKYGSQTFGLGNVGDKAGGPAIPVQPARKPKWVQAQDAAREGMS